MTAGSGGQRRTNVEREGDSSATLLAAVPFPSTTGYAWAHFERLLGAVADRLAETGMRTLVAYPKLDVSPAALEGTAAEPVELDARLESPEAVLETARFVRRAGARTLFLLDQDVFSSAYPLLRLAGVRSIVTHCFSSGAADAPTGLRYAVKRLAARSPASADRIVAVSDFVRDREIDARVLPPHRVTRIWSGVEIPSPPRDEEKDTRERFGVEDSRPLVACAARASPVKGVSYLIRAFGRIVEEWPKDGVPPALVYAGDGPKLDELEDLRADVGLDEHVIMPGYVEDATRVLAGADVFVSPSVWQDAFPYAVLEPLALGKPVVASCVGGIPEQIEDGESGLLVPPADDDALAEAITLLLRDEELRKRLGRNARRRVRNRFGFSQEVDSLSRLLLAEAGRTATTPADRTPSGSIEGASKLAAGSGA